MAAEGASSSSSGLTLSGCLVLCDLGLNGHARTCKVREKPHRDVPPYMDELEPSYALKCIELEQDMTTEGRQRAVQEMQTLLNLTHPNVVRYHRAFLYEGRLCYMTEFAECGTLHHLVFTVKERGQRLPDALVWHLFTQVCNGLKKLHDSGIVHRALKTRNLLLFPEQLYHHPYLKYRCKLTDLGIPELQRRLRLGALDGSTLRYLAPEVLSGQQLGDERADVWSLGCVLYEMVTLSHAFNATSAIQKGGYTPLPGHTGHEVQEVLAAIFQLDPAARPTIDELLHLPAVAACAAEMPNPVLLEGAYSVPGSGGSEGAKQAPGTMVWAKQASDGMWHRGVVHSSVDADCCFVHFVERRSVELVWHHDGLRVVPPSPNTASAGPSRASSSSSSVIPGLARSNDGDSNRDSNRELAVGALKDHLAASTTGGSARLGESGANGSSKPARMPSMVRWSEELSDHGELHDHSEDGHGEERGGADGERRRSEELRSDIESHQTRSPSRGLSLTSTTPTRASLPVSSLDSGFPSERPSLSGPMGAPPLLVGGLASHPETDDAAWFAGGRGVGTPCPANALDDSQRIPRESSSRACVIL